MKLTSRRFDLTYKHDFSISGCDRGKTQPLVLTELEHEGITGYGEASKLFPYYDESQDDIMEFLSQLNLEQFKDPSDIAGILSYVDNVSPGHTAAKCAVDIALHDLLGKIQQKPCYEFFNSKPENMPWTTLTIGIDNVDMIRQKVQEAQGFNILKIKLGSGYDKEIIEAVRAETDLPLTVDANQGWKDRQEAVEMTHWLNTRNVVFIEQPMPAADREGNAWVTEHSPIPIVADEAIQRLSDMENVKGAYHGINVKLMKCTGMHEGFKIIKKARELNMKIMIGCMSETSCAIMAGAALAPLCDWADLDGPWLSDNNPFSTPELKDGKIVLTNKPGLGL